MRESVETAYNRALWLVSALITLAVLAIVTDGRWLEDELGQVPRDFLPLWSAGLRVWAGDPLLAYDWDAHNRLQELLLDRGEERRLGFFHPPHFLFLAGLLGLFAYVEGVLFFLAISALLYAAALRRITRDWLSAIGMSLAFGGAVVSLWWVQLGFLTAALLVGGLALLPRRPALAGILFGVLTIKPQLGIVLAFALLAWRRWNVIAWASGTAILLALAAELVFGPGAWTAFLRSTDIAASLLEAGRLKVQSFFGILLPYLGYADAMTVHVILATAILFPVLVILRSGARYELQASALVSATLLVSPYLFSYDAVMLTGAAAFLIRGAPRMSDREQFFLVIICMLPAAYVLPFRGAVPLGAGLMLCLALGHAMKSRQWKPDSQKGVAVSAH